MNRTHVLSTRTGASTSTRAPISVFERRGVEWVCWVLAIILLAVYCGARSHGELERRDAFATFIHSRSP
jgi:hypothetical protein